MRIFITGVTGFVGRNLVSHFKSQSDIVLFGHSRDEAGARQQFNGLPVSFQQEYSAVLSDQLEVDVVIHLAGIAHDLSNQYTPEDYFRVNTERTKNVFDAFLQAEATKFIFISSIKAVVDTADQPVDESKLPAPVSDYGKSKLKAEQYILSKKLPAGKFVYILRPAMIHGPGNKGNLNLLYKVVKTGIPWPLGKYHNQRSFLSIDNFIFVLEYLIREDVPSGIYHLADSGFISTNDLVKQVASAMNKKIAVWNFPTPWINTVARITGQQARLYKLTENMMVSNSKIVAQLGQSLPTTLVNGIVKTIRSFNE